RTFRSLGRAWRIVIDEVHTPRGQPHRWFAGLSAHRVAIFYHSGTRREPAPLRDLPSPGSKLSRICRKIKRLSGTSLLQRQGVGLSCACWPWVAVPEIVYTVSSVRGGSYDGAPMAISISRFQAR